MPRCALRRDAAPGAPPRREPPPPPVAPQRRCCTRPRLYDDAARRGNSSNARVRLRLATSKPDGHRRMTTTHSETARQLVHMGSGCFALLLRYLTWWQAAGLACVAIAFNAAILPLVGGRKLYRPSDHARGFPPGILIYP